MRRAALAALLLSACATAPTTPTADPVVPATVETEPVASADDAAYAIFELADGVIAQFNSSWTVRVHRDELLELQVDGTHGEQIGVARATPDEADVADGGHLLRG